MWKNSNVRGKFLCDRRAKAQRLQTVIAGEAFGKGRMGRNNEAQFRSGATTLLRSLSFSLGGRNKRQ
jgi:hypothetical protein